MTHCGQKIFLVAAGLYLSACQPIVASNGQIIGYRLSPMALASQDSVPQVKALSSSDASPVATSAEINRLVRRNMCPNIDTRILGTVTLGGLSGPITLIHIFGDSCGGGNATVNELAGIYRRNGIVSVAESLISGPEQAEQAKDGRVYIQTLEVGPNDGRCCPTLRRRAQIVFRAGKIVEAR